MSILSVGYHFTFTPETIAEIFRAIGSRVPDFDPSKYTIEPVITAGVWYGTMARTMGRDWMQDDGSMTAWYGAHRNTTSMSLRSVYLQKKFIFGVFQHCSDITIVVLSNQSKGTRTTIHKKACVSGVYGPAIDISPISVPVNAYIDRIK